MLDKTSTVLPALLKDAEQMDLPIQTLKKSTADIALKFSDPRSFQTQFCQMKRSNIC